MSVGDAVLTETLQIEIANIAGTVYARYCSRGGSVQLDKEDLTSIGIIGALEAADRFDPIKGNWMVFARMRARGAMLDKVRKMALVSMGQDGYEKVKQLEQARRELLQKDIEPTNKLLAEQLGWSLADVQKWLAQRPILVPATDGDAFADDEETIPGTVLMSADIGPEEASLRLEVKKIVEDCLDRLPSADLRMILVSRILHGIKLKELAASFDCAMQSVLNKQKKATDWMRQCIKAKGWPEEGWGTLFSREGDK